MSDSSRPGPDPDLEAGGYPHHVRLVLSVNDFHRDWRRYNLVSNYLAEYSSYLFDQKDRAENLISSVFYELIEHLGSSSRTDTDMDIRFSTVRDHMVFEVSSRIAPEELLWLRELLEEFKKNDIDSYYKSLLEADLDAQSVNKKMGMVMIAHDYNARFSAVIDDQEGAATIRALISQQEISA